MQRSKVEVRDGTVLKSVTSLFVRILNAVTFDTPATPAPEPYDRVTPWRGQPAAPSFATTTCEVCGADGLPLQYGFTISRPGVVLAGCTIYPGMPRYACPNCETRWNLGDEDYYDAFRKQLDG